MFLYIEKQTELALKPSYQSKAASDILSNFQNKNVEAIWSAFKSYIQSGIKTFIPVKSC